MILHTHAHNVIHAYHYHTQRTMRTTSIAAVSCKSSNQILETQASKRASEQASGVLKWPSPSADRQRPRSPRCSAAGCSGKRGRHPARARTRHAHSSARPAPRDHCKKTSFFRTAVFPCICPEPVLANGRGGSNR